MSVGRNLAAMTRIAGVLTPVLAASLLSGCKTDVCNNECAAGETCDSATASCVSNADAGPIVCSSASDCPKALPKCSPDNLCVACLQSSDCASGTICDLTTFTCQTGCLGQHDCKNPALPVCSIEGKCVECTSDLNCTELGGVRRTCDPGTNTCMLNPCKSNADCSLDSLGNRACDTASGGCVACTANTDCTKDRTKALCNPATFQCVACVSDSDCTNPGETCSRETNTCVTGGCTSDANCSGDQHCDTTTSTCVQCLVSSDCDFGGKCAGNVCVEPATCSGDPDCLYGTFCAQGTCVGCRTSTDCGTGQSCVNGTCEAPASCTVSDVCGPGFVCTNGTCKAAMCSTGTSPHQTPGTATALNLAADNFPLSETLCPNNTDYYVVAAGPGDGVQATVTYSAAAPALSIELVPGPGLVANAVSASVAHAGTTQATLGQAPAGTRAVLVAVSGGDGQSVTYDLTVDVSSTPLCAHDSRWPDESQAQAPLVTPGSYSGALCPEDVEWFAINVPANQKPVATLTSDGGAGDLAVVVYTEVGGVTMQAGYWETDGAGSASITANMSAATGGQQYWVEVVNSVETRHAFTLNIALLANPPPNDHCASAQPLPLNNTTAATTLGASTDGAASCGGVEDVFWTLTLTQLSQVTITLNAQFSGVLSLAADCADDGEQECRSGMSPKLQFLALPAGTYVVRVAGSTAADVGSYSITTQVQQATPPTTATCAAPLSLDPLSTSSATTVQGNVAGAADNVTSPCGHSGGDAAYSFTLTHAQHLEAALDGFAGAGLTLVPAASCDSPAGATCVAAGASGMVSLLQNAVPPGDYVLIVDGGSSVSGQFSLTVTLSDPIYEPSNDSCASPADLTSGTDMVSGDTRAAADNYTPTCGAQGAQSGGVVYHVNVATEQQLTLELSASFNAALSVTGSPCVSGTALACESGMNASVVLPVIEPGDYYIWVDGYDTETGTFTLTSRLTDPEPVPTNETCATAQPVIFSGGSGMVTGSTLRSANTVDPSDCLQKGSNTPLALAGPDVVYSVAIPAGQTLTAVLNPTTFDGALYVVNSCSDATCIAASDQSFQVGGQETVQVANPGSTVESVFVVVGSWASTARGDFTLELTLN